MRVLGRVRLSRATQESTSVERQRELIEHWAKVHGHEIVAWAEDVDVSGAVSPFDTPGFGKYLVAPLMHDWDIVCAWKLDRFARRTVSLHQLFAWVTEHDKQLVCVSDNIDLSTWVGRLIASVIAGVAEGELEAMSLRAKQTQKHNRLLGKWVNGHPPYGYQIVDDPVQGKRLAQHPEQAKVVRWMYEEILAGATRVSVARRLNEQGVPSSFAEFVPGAQWDATGVTRILQNKVLMGWVTRKGHIVLDDQGKPLIQCEGILSFEEFQKLQNALKKSAKVRKAKKKHSNLLKVAVCWGCGKPLYMRRSQGRKQIFEHYVCTNTTCGNKDHVAAWLLEKIVYQEFERRLGQHNIRTPKPKQSEQVVKTQLGEAKAAYEDVASFLSKAQTQDERTILFEQLKILSGRINGLKAELTNNQQEYIVEDRTYLDEWLLLDAQGKRKFLVDLGITVTARVLAKGTKTRAQVLDARFVIPGVLEDLLQT